MIGMDDSVTVWPDLPYASWRETAATLQLWTQIVGKVRLTLPDRRLEAGTASRWNVRLGFRGRCAASSSLRDKWSPKLRGRPMQLASKRMKGPTAMIRRFGGKLWGRGG